MPRDYSSAPPNAVRRRDRAVTDDAWIRRVLSKAPYGVFATVHEGQPFLNSNLFVFDEAGCAIYAHTAAVGRMRANVAAGVTVHRGGAPVCFSTFQMGRILPADVAREFSVEYAGVTVFGQMLIVQDHEESEHALQALLGKYAPHLLRGADYSPITEGEVRETSVYRMSIDSWSGKRKIETPNYGGAYCYPEFDLLSIS